MSVPDSWIEISSQPSSSSLSSINDEIVTTGLRVHHDAHHRRRRRIRQGAPSHLSITNRAPSSSSQEEYEESESESDQVMTSSSEGLDLPLERNRSIKSPALESTASDDSEEDDRTAINHPTNNDHIFTPQPNAFSHASGQIQARSQLVPGSYFPPSSDRSGASRHSSNRHSYPPRQPQHSPYSMLSPRYNAAADHDAALRASLSTLISFAGAARSLSKKSSAPPSPAPRASGRPEPSTLCIVPESALQEDEGTLRPRIPATRAFDGDAHFKPTIRRNSTSTTTSAESRAMPGKSEAKRKAAAPRSSSKDDRRISKKQRRTSCDTAAAEFFVTPTLFTWVVVAGVGVFISALSFTAGYAIGRERGLMEVSVGEVGEMGGCAREVSRSGLGLRKLKFGGTVGVGA